MRELIALLAVVCANVWANPYPDPNQVPVDPPRPFLRRPLPRLPTARLRAEAIDALRVAVDWDSDHDSYRLAGAVIEPSGTEALLQRALRPNPLGSYRAQLGDFQGAVFSHDAIGTGQEFRRLTRRLTFRFPVPQAVVLFRLSAENPTTGRMEEVLRELIDPKDAPHADPALDQLEVRSLAGAAQSPSLRVVLYAEGFRADRRDAFWRSAQNAIDTLKAIQFPGLDKLELRGVFAPSDESLGSPRDLTLPVTARDSFLGLFFPYWEKFGRWTDVVYPTNEERYRAAIGRVGYDYPIALVDSANYWGIGNFNELTAIPISHPSFSYLLVHEFGHYFGLNEEYEGGGPTELAFAPQVDEPWSQNITFHTDSLKWKSDLDPATPIPTPSWQWHDDGPLGAYQGGYADTPPLHQSYKPGYACVMRAGRRFCDVCRRAIQEKIRFDLGL